MTSGDAFSISRRIGRTFQITRLFKETLSGHPLRAFAGNYSQKDVMQEVRKKLKKYKDLRCSVRNVPAFNIGGGNFEIDFAIQGPSLEALERYTTELKERTTELGASSTPTPRCGSTDWQLRVVIDPSARRTSAVRTEDIATALRLMVGGEDEVSRFRDPNANENYDVQLRLIDADRGEVRRSGGSTCRCSTACDTARGVEPGAPAAQTARTCSGRILVRLDNLVRFEQALSPSRIDRLDRQRVSSCAPDRARLRTGDRLKRLRGAVPRDGFAAGLQLERARARRRARAHRGEFIGRSCSDRAMT